jgi:putative tricarboxylic transport membrane protein
MASIRGNVVRVNDAISGLVLILFALGMIGLSFGIGEYPGQRFHPSLFPRLLGAGLIVCGLILILRGRAAQRAGQALVAIDPWLRDGPALLRAAAIPLACLVYVLAAERIGFVPVAFVLLGGLFLLYGVRPAGAFLAATVAVLGTDWFFGYLFRVPLPIGILPNHPSYALANFLRSLF